MSVAHSYRNPTHELPTNPDVAERHLLPQFGRGVHARRVAHKVRTKGPLELARLLLSGPPRRWEAGKAASACEAPPRGKGWAAAGARGLRAATACRRRRRRCPFSVRSDGHSQQSCHARRHWRCQRNPCVKPPPCRPAARRRQQGGRVAAGRAPARIARCDRIIATVQQYHVSLSESNSNCTIVPRYGLSLFHLPSDQHAAQNRRRGFERATCRFPRWRSQAVGAISRPRGQPPPARPA